MGTVGYMSPEQVRGLPADHRSDIFCLGAVLYEMLSGRRAFLGATAADTMSAILNAEPPELSGSGRKFPTGVERIVRHCLEKNPEERFQSARDLAFDLESLSQTSGEQGVVGAPRRKLRSAALVAAAALALLGAGALGGWLLLRRTPTAQEVSFHRLTFRRGNLLSARFAPDGQTVAYAAAWEGAPAEIFTVRTDGTESRPLGPVQGGRRLDLLEGRARHPAQARRALDTRRQRDPRPRPVERRDAARSSGGRVLCELGA